MKCAQAIPEGATAFAEALIAKGAGKRLTRDITPAITDDDTALLSQTRDTIAKRLKGQTAPQRILDCLEAAGTMAGRGLAAERRAFEACMEDPQSTALRHLLPSARRARLMAWLSARRLNL